MKKRTTPLFVLTALLLSCGGQNPSSESTSSTEPSSSSEPSSESSSLPETYIDKQVNVFYVDATQNQKATLRFYDDSGDVPYMSIKDFYAMLLKGRSADASRSQLGIEVHDNVYTVTAPGGKAVFDVDENLMSTDNLAFFISTKTYESGYNAMLGTDGMPWIRIGNVTPDVDPQKTVVDFDDYHIDLHGDGQNLYLPLPTLQDLFSDSDLLTSLYNRKDIYVYVAYQESTAGFGLDLYEPCLKTNLGVDYATYLYNEMCFNYDVLLGRPTRSSLERYYDLSQGLDHALQSRPYGRLLKENLTDGTALGYATGLMMLHYIIADGGHSNAYPFSNTMTDPETKLPAYPSWEATLRPKVNEIMETIKTIGYEELDNTCQLYSHHDEIRRNRQAGLNLGPTHTDSLRGEETYKKINDTAFIFIDDYMGDCLRANEWKKYYAGEGELPFGPSSGGAVASIYKDLIKAGEDEGVKNVVIDLSSNQGGSVDEMMYVISLLTGDATLRIGQRQTGQNLVATFDVDRNLDRVFDEKDAAFNPIQGKNVAVLMSQNGFSCGGISPIYLHDRGLFTMGDDSGGGCCSILFQYTGVGLRTVRSSSDAVLDKNGKKIDLVREGSCDHKFEIKTVETETGTELDYSAFFNVTEIERVIADHFAAK